MYQKRNDHIHVVDLRDHMFINYHILVRFSGVDVDFQRRVHS
jgi:hypothetical protein